MFIITFLTSNFKTHLNPFFIQLLRKVVVKFPGDIKDVVCRER